MRRAAGAAQPPAAPLSAHNWPASDHNALDCSQVMPPPAMREYRDQLSTTPTATPRLLRSRASPWRMPRPWPYQRAPTRLEAASVLVREALLDVDQTPPSASH